MNDSTENPNPAFAQVYGSAGAPGVDWKVFSDIFMNDRGYFPHHRDTQHRELFYWFLRGAKEESEGRLAPPNHMIIRQMSDSDKSDDKPTDGDS